MLPVFLHFQYSKSVVCDNCKKSGSGMIVFMKHEFCKDCAKKIIPIYQSYLNEILKEIDK